MKKILAIMVLVLFLIACETVDEDSALQEAEEAEQKVEELNQQIAALSEQMERIEEKLDGDKEITEEVVEEQVIEEIPDNMTQLTNLSPIILATDDSVPPSPLGPQQEEEAMTEEIREILSKADDTITSYSFLYALPPSDISSSMIYIKGNKMKIKLRETSVYGEVNYLDTIYVDFDAKTANGYCEDSRINACANRSKKTVLDYEEYRIKTPYQWLKEIPVARKFANVIVWDRNADVLEHIEGNTTYTYWIDEFSGIPVKINVIKRGEEPIYYEFRHLSINYLKDSDVIQE